MIKISAEERERIIIARKKNKNKRIEKLLEVLELRSEGKSNKEISEQTGYNERYITTLMQKYQKQGLEEFIRIKQTSHNRNLTTAEEAEILKPFEVAAAEGKVLTVAEINQAFEERLERKLPHNYVYRVLRRHGWRKIMPRSKHPKAASKEEQSSQKKLKPDICE